MPDFHSRAVPIGFLVLGLVATVAPLAWPSTAHGDDPVRWIGPDAPASPEAGAEARAHFEAGLAAVEDERWADAAQSFRRAYTLSGESIALFNGASALRSLGRVREARDLFRQLLAAPTSLTPERIAVAREFEAEVALRVATVELTGIEPGAARVSVDGMMRGVETTRPIVVELDPGEHHVLVELDRGRAEWRGHVSEGARRRASLELLRPSPEIVIHQVAAPSITGPSPAPSPETGPSVGSSPWLWTGVGLVVVGIAVVLGLTLSGALEPEDRRLQPLSDAVLHL